VDFVYDDNCIIVLDPLARAPCHIVSIEVSILDMPGLYDLEYKTLGRF